MAPALGAIATCLALAAPGPPCSLLGLESDSPSRAFPSPDAGRVMHQRRVAPVCPSPPGAAQANFNYIGETYFPSSNGEAIDAKKSFPLSSTTMNAGKSSTSIRHTASIPSSG